MPKAVIGLNLHLKRTHVAAISINGKVVRQRSFNTKMRQLWNLLRPRTFRIYLIKE